MSFWEGETYAIIKAMKATGNRPGIIAAWKEYVELWAISRPGDRNAGAVLAWLPHWYSRAGYTVDELVPMWPALAIAIGHTTYWSPVSKAAKRLQFELDYAGLPFRELRGQKYYLVERIHYWKNAPLEDFEREIFGA